MKKLTNEEFKIELNKLKSELKKSEEETNIEVYSINIVKEYDGTYDISIWDEIENERCEDLEEGHFATLDKAETRLNEIINENQSIRFLRYEDRLN